MDRLVTLGLLESLKNSDDILEGKMVELNKKNQNNQMDQMLFKNVILL